MGLNTTRFETLREPRGWRWYLMGQNGPVARSACHYKTERGAVKGLERFRSLPLSELPVFAGKTDYGQA